MNNIYMTTKLVRRLTTELFSYSPATHFHNSSIRIQVLPATAAKINNYNQHFQKYQRLEICITV